jgi:hypothetical protein
MACESARRNWNRDYSVSSRKPCYNLQPLAVLWIISSVSSSLRKWTFPKAGIELGNERRHYLKNWHA